MTLSGALARAEDAGSVVVDEDLENRGRMKGSVARAALVIPGVERAQIKTFNVVADEIRQGPFGQPVLPCAG